MLATTLAVSGGITMDKISEDSTKGTVYQDPASTRTHPHQVTVKHEQPAVGKVGLYRDLIQTSTHILDASSFPTPSRVIVNLSVSRPSDGDATNTAAAVSQCLLDMIVAISNGTTADTFVVDALKGQY